MLLRASPGQSLMSWTKIVTSNWSNPPGEFSLMGSYMYTKMCLEGKIIIFYLKSLKIFNRAVYIVGKKPSYVLQMTT